MQIKSALQKNVNFIQNQLVKQKSRRGAKKLLVLLPDESSAGVAQVMHRVIHRVVDK